MPFWARLSIVTSTVVLVTMAAVGTQTYFQMRKSVDELSSRIIEQNANMIDEKIGTLLGRAESHSRLLAELLRPTVGADRDLFTSTDLLNLAPLLIAIMSQNEEFGTMTITLASTGEYIQATQQPNGAIRVEVIELIADGSRVRKIYRKFGDVLQQYLSEPNWVRDPTTEAYYQLVESQLEQVWTETYMFPSSTLPETPGTTCATPIFDSRRRLIGVATVDLTIDNLSRFLKTVHIGKRGYAFLAEMRGPNVPLIIAHPTAELIRRDGDRLALRTSAELDDPRAAKLVSMIQAQEPLEATEVRRIDLAVDDVSYFSGVRLVSGYGRPRWIVAVVVPTDEYLGGIIETGVFLFWTAIIATQIGIIVSILLARRLAAPMQDLVQETKRIQDMSFEARPLEKSNIDEIDELAGAMESMKTVLRSFEKLVPTEYVRHLVSTGREAILGGERKHITTYFADIVGFTRLSEQLPPEELVAVLAEYLDVMSAQVIELGGTVDKYNGDDVMAFWGAPNEVENSALLACRAAISTRRALEAKYEDWQSRDMPVLKASFGISTGDVIVGNVGSTERMTYTVIGDSVNLASRLQGLNKYYETEMLIGDQTQREAGDGIVTRHIDFVAVAGREHPAQVYELLGLAGEVSEDIVEYVREYDNAMALYRARKFAEAAKVFQARVDEKPHDTPARILLKRCLLYIEHPPGDDWDGSFRLDHK